MPDQPTPAATRPGLLLVIVGPSGVGKSSLCDQLLHDHDGDLGLSVSYTTRAPRGTEQHGVEYFFIDEPRFLAMVADGLFAEHALVHGNFYGTALDTIRQARIAGRDLLFDIDYQGAAQIKAAFPDAVGIMVAPPDMDTLEARLTARQTDTPQTIARRLAAARTELAQVDAFDYLVINDDFDRAYADVQAIYRASRLRVPFQRAHVRDCLKLG